MSASDVIHLIDRDGLGTFPLCRDVSHASNWTTLPIVATCRECLAQHVALALPREVPDSRRVVELA